MYREKRSVSADPQITLQIFQYSGGIISAVILLQNSAFANILTSVHLFLPRILPLRAKVFSPMSPINMRLDSSIHTLLTLQNFSNLVI